MLYVNILCYIRMAYVLSDITIGIYVKDVPTSADKLTLKGVPKNYPQEISLTRKAKAGRFLQTSQWFTHYQFLK